MDSGEDEGWGERRSTTGRGAMSPPNVAKLVPRVSSFLVPSRVLLGAGAAHSIARPGHVPGAGRVESAVAVGAPDEYRGGPGLRPKSGSAPTGTTVVREPSRLDGPWDVNGSVGQGGGMRTLESLGSEGTDGVRPRRMDVIRSQPGVLHTLWEWTRAVVLALVFFLAIRAWAIEAFRIPTSSMEKTLLVGDFLLVNKFLYGAEIPGTRLRLPPLAEPDRGDVIVFHPPHEPEKNYVKRLVGVPGDTLEMVEKILYLNGRRHEEPYAQHIDRGGDAVHPGMNWQSHHLIAGPGDYHPSRDTWGPIVVPPGSFFVLGDNRDNSEDSRYWGFVNREEIRGKPWIVYYSFDPSNERGVPWLSAIRWGRIGATIE
jgi:signal peptidase I